MNQFEPPSQLARQYVWSIDRWGIFASVLCAIHCLITPVFFLLLPKFGELWAHPSSHWIMALIVIPLAFISIKLNRRQPNSRLTSTIGIIGIIFITLGALTPYAEKHFENSFAFSSASPAETQEEASCTDSCCPTVAVQESGQVQWTIPLASIITTLGGLLLIVTHFSNIRCCLKCKN
ncbi:MerC domain-containing protein [Rubritalea spongiae]|uniref:MerC domain-containing protein n=1 Tax=Rubritalea spongiae TaxID=430797 RepID=A0ABW5E1C3_9BACT